MEAPRERCPRLRDGGVYLITGGLGGIGLAFAEYMYQQVKAKLVLVGRTGLPPKAEWAGLLAAEEGGGKQEGIQEKIRKVMRLEQAGAEVMVVAADVAELEQMQGVVRQAAERFGTIHGVFHAAGLPGQGLTQLKSAQTAARVLAPKIQGTLVLEAALKHVPLDFLLLVSSSPSFTGGGPGQIDYCAANSFLDAYARRNFVKHGITVAMNFGEWQWDAWSEGLQGFQPEVREAFIANRKKFGIAFEEGMEAINRVLSADIPQVIVVAENFVGQVEGSNECTARKLTEEVNKTRKQQQRSYPRPALGTSYVAAGNELERKIAEIWQRVLGIESIGVQDNLFDLGGNSLVGLQVIADLKKELEADITPIALYEAPTVSAFARYLNPDVDLRKSAVEEELVTRREQVRRTRGSREIAIVGMAGRFPGARNVSEFWQNISSGVESLRSYSDAEMVASGVDRAKLKNPNYIKAGCSIGDIDFFDAMLFGYAPREAETIDPQHRFFLECAWEALEDAGYDPDRYRGMVGVFGGANTSKYHASILSRPDLLTSGAAVWQASVGNSSDSLATRVSYKLNLRGPSLSVQTFCSTSGVATHMACQSLLAGECDMALAGGVNINVPGKTGYLYEEGSIDSPDGHTRTFDARAKGAVIGDGVGIVVLKRLDEALSDGDHIYAVIKGSAINNDGSVKVGYTAPSVEGQCSAIGGAVCVAGVEADSIGYVEAHGTATELGDPIEVMALTKAYRNRTERRGICAGGCVKTNVGHLDRAAGVTALIKTALSLQHEFIPPLLHYQSPNPNIDFENSPFYVCAQPTPWKKNGTVRRAGVNVVGLGGTNVHMILEEAPEVAASGSSRQSHLLLLSAKSESALEAATERLSGYLEENPEVNLADVAYTLQVGRKKLEYRRALVCKDRADAITALAAKDPQRVLTYFQQPRKKSVVFLFPGVGEQYVNMAAGLYKNEPLFHSEMDECCDLLRSETGMDLRAVLLDESVPGTGSADLQKLFFRGVQNQEEACNPLNRTHLAQPAVFVIEYCLAQLLMSWGIVPQGLIGYSVGEFAAATIAGSLSLPDALRLVAGRAKLIEKLPGGAMLAVPWGEEQLRPLLGEGLCIAICNGPKLTVVAGGEEAIGELEGRLQEQEIVSRRLQTTHAFHSKMMEAGYDELVKLVQTVELKEPQIPYVSNVTGTWIKAEEATDAEYWARHMCQTVRFGEGLRAILSKNDKVLVEVGPGQGLSSMVKQHPDYKREEDTVVSTMRTVYSEEDDQEVLLGALGKLWLAGTEIDWNAYYGQEKRRRIPLPTYPFDRQSFWIQPKKAGVTLYSRIASAEEKAEMADWFYVPIWKVGEGAGAWTGAGARKGGKPWLVLSDEGGLGEEIAEKIKEKGISVVVARPGSAYGEKEDGSYGMRMGEKADYSALLKELRKRGRTPERIVHLWTAEGRGEEGAGLEGLGERLERSFYSLFYLAQAIGDQLTTEEIELCVVSSDMQQVTGEEELSAEKATVKGPCKVIRQEYANVSCRSVDIWSEEALGAGRERLVEQVAAELGSGSREQFVALRQGQRWTQEFEQVRMEAPRERCPRLRDGGVYLITGGLGGIGLAFAEYMYQQVKAKLVLVGRTGLPPKAEWAGLLAAGGGGGEQEGIQEKIRKVMRLEQAGAEVMVVAADVAELEQMQGVVRQAVERFGTIHGVFHAAGLPGQGLGAVEAGEGVGREAVERFGTIHGVFHAAGLPGQGLTQLKSAQTAARVLAPKIQGTLVLEAALKHVPLDFLLLVSSSSSFTGGGPGQIDYCAANSFLDAYARRNFVKHGITVAMNFGEWQWDAWSEGLQGFQPEVREAFIANRKKFGIAFEEGMEAINRVLSADIPQVIVVAENFVGQVEGSNECTARKLTEEVNKTRKQQQRSYPRPALGTSYVAAGNELERKIAEIWQRVLGIESIGVQDNLFDLGGNSLVGLQVIADLKKELEADITPIALYEAPTVSAFARYLNPDVDLRKAAVEEELVTRREQVRRTRGSREIAIVGMAGRFPGARNVSEFWQNISSGVESLRSYSDAEMVASGVDRAKLKNPNYIKAGCSIGDIDFFDAMLFGYAPREAETIDPQHRFFLECAWEALEDAGYDPDRYAGLIGVFGGASSSKYHSNIVSRPDLTASGVAMLQAGVGNTNDALATRVSYKLNLRGPSLSVQTFCSTSGVATHMACQSLLAGECDMALAGGVNINVPGKTGYLYEEG